LGRAVVPRQDDPLRLRVDPLEAQDVAEGRAAEAEDALVVVADDGQVAMEGGQHLEELELDVVRVLEFVDQDVLVAPLEFLEDGRPRPEEVDDERHLVLEIDQALFLEQGLVFAEHAGDLGVLAGCFLLPLPGRPAGQSAGVPLVVLGPDVLLLEAADRLEQLLDMTRRIAQRPVILEGKAEQVLAEEDGLFDIVEELEVRRVAEVEGVVSKDSFSERVERADLDEGVRVGDEDVDAGFHFASRLLSEGHGQDLLGPGLLRGNEAGDAVGNDLGLARPRPRDDEERARAVEDGPALGGVERREELPFVRVCRKFGRGATRALRPGRLTSSGLWGQRGPSRRA